MKKIALILVVIICCSVLVGCGLQNIGAIISDKLFHIEGTVLTAAETTDGDTVYITHGDNFSQDDIEFVLSLHGEKRNDKIPKDIPGRAGIEYVLNAGKEGQPIFTSYFEDLYIICAYLKPGTMPYIPNIWGDYQFDITKYIWFKFTDTSQMVEAINGAKWTEDAYLLYDCTLEKDVVNNVEYNKTFKCYIKYEGDYSYEYVTSNMLLFFNPQVLSNVLGKLKHVAFPLYTGDAFGIYKDEDGVDYLRFSYSESQYIFGEHYDSLSPYFEVLDEDLNDKGTSPVKSVRIKLSNVISYVNDGR